MKLEQISFQRIKKAVIRASLLFICIHLYNLLIAPNQIDQKAKPYYNSFIAEAQHHNKGLIKYFKVSIIMKPLPTHQLGNCRSLFGFKPIVNINSSHWATLNDIQKEMVVYHELAHCLLLKGHGLQDQPETLMTKKIFEDMQYLANKDKYLAELFEYKSYHTTNFIISFFQLEEAAQLLGFSSQ